MIPFLLSDGMLGIVGYGQVATLLALYALLLIVTDGVRVSQTRTIARSVDTEPENGKIVGSCTQIMAIISLPISLIIFLFPGLISEMAGLPSNSQMILAIVIIGVIYFVENVFSIVVAGLHAIRKTYLVNAVICSEVILRNAAIFGVFILFKASVLIYFQIFMVIVCLKFIAFLLLAAIHRPAFFKGLTQARPAYGLPTLLYSFPILANSFTPALLYRGSVIIVNKFLGSEAAAFLSILVVTIRNYVTQLTYGSLHPMMVPLSARINPGALSEKDSKFISESFRCYAIAVFGICFAVSACAREFLSLWLGSDYAFLTLAFQGFMFAAALDLSISPIRSFLIAHGHASQLFRLTLPVGLICFVGMLVTVALGAPWEMVIVFIMIFTLISYGITVDWVFAAEFPSLPLSRSGSGWFARALAATILGVVAWGASMISAEFTNAFAGAAAALILVATAVVIVSHVLIIDVASARKFGSTVFEKLARHA